MTVTKKIAIIQPNYIPWKGYFDVIHAVDAFVFFDDVQYTVRDWRNRNKIKLAAGGTSWLTVPTLGGREQRICDVQIDHSQPWARKHLAAIRHSYSRSKFFREAFEAFETVIQKQHALLVDLDIELTKLVCGWLGITTALHRSSEMPAASELVKDGRLIDLCQKLGGTYYLSGPAAKDYIQPSLWADAGIELAWQDYSGYPAYPQIGEPFDPFVTVLDLIFSVGPAEAPRYIWDHSARPIPVRE
jgi:hypothetical protein